MTTRRILGIVTTISFIANLCITMGLVLGIFNGSPLIGQLIILCAGICIITGTFYIKITEKDSTII